MAENTIELTVLLCRWQAKQELCIELAELLQKAKVERDEIKTRLAEVEQYAKDKEKAG